ncbi:DUF3866 family protein [Paenibacillus sp. 32352]|uniref:DUF3866 family protein n=1 Tax=Paenibacillus sp. 32352 TaxID=1969111 RepID=UPI0015C4B8E5|nr:DUF3866 family protein [Paenibacillus sp. 32352]
MIEWQTARVTDIRNTEESSGKLGEITVQFSNGTEGTAVYYTDELGERVKTGDQVLLNTTAVSLGLGTGGVHFVHAILDRQYTQENGSTVEEESSERGGKSDCSSIPDDSLVKGHIMKLRYTSLQRSVLAVEEPSSPHHDLFTRKLSLEGMPVLVGELHSMLPAIMCRLKQRMNEEGRRVRIAYVMSDSASLPIAFSKHVRQLRQLQWLAGCITFGQAYGGDLEAVNKYTALLAARHVLQADLTIAVPGPGSVGTSTLLGFSGTEAAELLNAAGALHGMPIAVPRISFADKRERHRGISHHTLTILGELTQIRSFVPLPILDDECSGHIRQQVMLSELALKHAVSWHIPVPEKQWQNALEAYSLPIASMGRGLSEDPAFWSAAGAAADLAWHYSSRP